MFHATCSHFEPLEIQLQKGLDWSDSRESCWKVQLLILFYNVLSLPLPCCILKCFHVPLCHSTKETLSYNSLHTQIHRSVKEHWKLDQQPNLTVFEFVTLHSLYFPHISVEKLDVWGWKTWEGIGKHVSMWDRLRKLVLQVGHRLLTFTCYCSCPRYAMIFQGNVFIRNVRLVLLPGDICCNCTTYSCIFYLVSQFYVLRVLDLVLEGMLIHETSAVLFICCFSCLRYWPTLDTTETQQKHVTRVLKHHHAPIQWLW